jgi:ribosome-associated protein
VIHGAAWRWPAGGSGKPLATDRHPRILESRTHARQPKAEAFENLTHQNASRSTAAAVNSTPTLAILRRRVLAALDELKARDIREIDVRGRTSIADLLIIASGTSSRHVKSIADEVVKYAKRAGMLPLGVEGEAEAEWVLVDLGDIIVHLMLPRIREFYGLERLWTVGDQAPDAEAANAG